MAEELQLQIEKANLPSPAEIELEVLLSKIGGDSSNEVILNRRDFIYLTNLKPVGRTELKLYFFDQENPAVFKKEVLEFIGYCSYVELLEEPYVITSSEELAKKYIKEVILAPNTDTLEIKGKIYQKKLLVKMSKATYPYLDAPRYVVLR